MRIYLACTVRGDRVGLEAARAAAARLRALGHELLTSHLLSDDVERAEAALSEADVFARDRRWLDECDVLVAEASGSTFGVGFEVGYITGRAPQTRQRVLVLFQEARQPAISRFISGYRSTHGATFGYRTADDVVRIIDEQFPPT
jgi:hypothetical protein